MAAKEIVEVPLGDGQSVLAEIEEYEPGFTRASAGRATQVVQTMREALEAIEPAVRSVVNTAKRLEPDEAEVEFGIRLNGKAGAVIASTELEGHFKVKIKWVKTPPPAK